MRCNRDSNIVMDNYKSRYAMFNSIETVPRRSMMMTPSTPLCEEIRAIVSSISAIVDDTTASEESILFRLFFDITGYEEWRRWEERTFPH